MKIRMLLHSDTIFHFLCILYCIFCALNPSTNSEISWIFTKVVTNLNHIEKNSGINVGPRFIKFVFFPGPTVLLKGSTVNQFSVKNRKNILFFWFLSQRPQIFAKFSMSYRYSRPYNHYFCQIFQALPAVRLFCSL